MDMPICNVCKIDKLFEIDCYQYTNLGTDSTIKEKDTVKKKYKLLTAWLDNNKIDFDRSAYVAQYNSPWVMGPFRRNEVWVKLK